MKKQISLFLAAALLLGGLAGCGQAPGGERASEASSTATASSGASSTEELYRYQATPQARPFDILDALKNIPPDSLPDGIYQYDKDAYYAGANEYGTTYIISENRSFHGIDGVVAYFDSEGGCGMDIWFRTPDITPKEFQQIVSDTEKDLGISFQISTYSASESSRSAADPDFTNEISDDPTQMLVTDDVPFQVDGIKGKFTARLQLYGINADAGNPPVYWGLEHPPAYGQEEKIQNELWLVISYPPCY